MKPASLQTQRGIAHRKVVCCAAPKQTGPGNLDLLLNVIPEGVLYRANLLQTLEAQHKASLAACHAVPPSDPKHFGIVEELQWLLLKTFKQLVQNHSFWEKPKAAAQELQDKAEAFCEKHRLPFEENDWLFELLDRVYISDAPDKKAQCYLVASAVSCSGHFGLWQIPEQLEQDLAALQSKDLAALQAARELEALSEGPGTSPHHKPYPPACDSSARSPPASPKHHTNISKGSDSCFFSTVIPPGTQHLLDKLRQLEMSSYENNSGQRFRLHFRTVSLEKRLAVALLALQLHVDPGGMLLHSKNMILRPRYSGSFWPQDNAFQFSSGSWRHGRQPAGVHTGSTALLIDNLNMPEWKDSGTSRLFSFPGDHANTHKVVRVATEGVSLYPPTPYASHVKTALAELQAVCQSMGWSVELGTEAGDSSSSSNSHYLSILLAHQYGWKYVGLLRKSRVVKRWWRQQSKQQQQAVQQQHPNINLQKLISKLELPTSRVDSRRDIAACVEATEQLWQVLPTAVLQQAVNGWRQSPRLLPHVCQLTQQAHTAVAPTATAAELAGAAGTSAAARQQPPSDLAAAAAVIPAATSLAAAIPRWGLVAPAAAVLAVPEPIQHVHEDPSPGSAQPSRRQKGAAGIAIPRQDTAAGPSTASTDKFDIADLAWRRGLGHRPAADYLHCGTLLVKQRLGEGDEAGVQAVIDLGDECWGPVDTMKTDGWLRWEYINYGRHVGIEGYLRGGVFKWGVKLRLNYGGQQLLEQQWEQGFAEQLEMVRWSSEAVSNANDFESGLSLPALKVETSFKIGKPNTCCRSRGDGLCVSMNHSSEHLRAAFRGPFSR